MSRPAKSLEQHVREQTFRARRETHRILLTGEPLQWHAFAAKPSAQELPMAMPARKTSTPPTTTWNAAASNGVSMKWWRI